MPDKGSIPNLGSHCSELSNTHEGFSRALSAMSWLRGSKVETTFSENISISKDSAIVGLSDRWGDFLIPKKLFMAIAGSIILSKNGRKGEGERRGRREREKWRKTEEEKGRFI